MKSGQLPKIVWMYWHQGEDAAPLLVRNCVNSWRKQNPNWEVRLLDQSSVAEFVDLSSFDHREDMGLQMRSDVIRVTLLSKYGGVWADASLLCHQPLDTWLEDYLHDSFFAFSCKRKDRIMTNWFLAGTGDSRILSEWRKAILHYWSSNNFRKPNYWTRQVLRKLMSMRKRQVISNDFWFSPFVTKLLKINPYPVNMYLFEKMLDENDELKSSWSSSKKLFDEPAEYLQNKLGMNAGLNEESKLFLDETSTPVHKLNWRQDLGVVNSASNLEYLLKLV